MLPERLLEHPQCLLAKGVEYPVNCSRRARLAAGRNSSIRIMLIWQLAARPAELDAGRPNAPGTSPHEPMAEHPTTARMPFAVVHAETPARPRAARRRGRHRQFRRRASRPPGRDRDRAARARRARPAGGGADLRAASAQLLPAAGAAVPPDRRAQQAAAARRRPGSTARSCCASTRRWRRSAPRISSSASWSAGSRSPASTIGFDFHFGANRAGSPDFLAAAGARHGFAVDIVPRVRGRRPAHLVRPDPRRARRRPRRRGDRDARLSLVRLRRGRARRQARARARLSDRQSAARSDLRAAARHLCGARRHRRRAATTASRVSAAGRCSTSARCCSKCSCSIFPAISTGRRSTSPSSTGSGRS